MHSAPLRKVREDPSGLLSFSELANGQYITLIDHFRLNSNRLDRWVLPCLRRYPTAFPCRKISAPHIYSTRCATDRQSNAQIITPASPALTSNSPIVKLAYIGAPPSSRVRLCRATVMTMASLGLLLNVKRRRLSQLIFTQNVRSQTGKFPRRRRFSAGKI
jgi:hypothetical protein